MDGTHAAGREAIESAEILSHGQAREESSGEHGNPHLARVVYVDGKVTSEMQR